MISLKLIHNSEKNHNHEVRGFGYLVLISIDFDDLSSPFTL